MRCYRLKLQLAYKNCRKKKKQKTKITTIKNEKIAWQPVIQLKIILLKLYP